ncbi:23S rRNA (guanosine(2251)-2'-O)-methyltransferase RlmB [Helicobacter winghamensis]|uniref:23S rRNA (Guanosine(2251)-2'-O)-methyltransferase RlmB n=1 Tax=Helicobacter winghamensis TaxID=157268 RepID=A0A2N3PJ98_9HELI|nr:23S rRNA (guanosine(2251)-2'-O)-methyltransferase RlmB [Helicobacter winghamensis]EEO25397.1 RNA methyltransferase, TrmH family, group 3 [Helicobacter winghamensis ATCC BAA-430]PKT78168.1 23S rRNA (guanosine(2251)-2'-O)-methyltransferase RlmB [Helicobacter winghamensis]PKT78437.1 23S rRNA (guanosine(2251)-2'-O)-methyltransferase RlmB [Helicobacter winghamensis]PKT78697.1 23S rRNA (guanosine(2251)-2'-O)-methyltransferase RlmB [Helicobacter winghamensis]PKT80468.1 23S rRNA (guanosine(2251)-2'
MVVYGKRVVEYILTKHSDKIQQVLLAKEIDKKQFRAFARLNVPLVRVDSKKAQSLARGGNHQGYLLEIAPLVPLEFSTLKAMNFVLVLCGISDVGNIGALFRTAFVLGVDGIVICGLKDFKQEGVLRASSGAMLDMPFCLVYNALDVANELKFAGFRLYGASLKGVESNGVTQGKKALFLGAEGNGLSAKILKKMDINLTIAQKREFDSLNVSTAGAILIDRIVNGRF